ncbi:hypothetical protein EHQ58_02025 [Leptospira ognonensis]|uniref:Uncharacterized protein n=1 Tax=Leptospira ognonensis TaxID=2484945 RepID=A0A4V3JS19_9LEPT|nr:hypothetical protein [Leptospira ognonensis]TGL62950.1 hypothetical protein EHQ58_02025 [Leptospira ognonensis]
MEYVESLLEEYYGLSLAFEEGTQSLGNSEAIEQLLAIEEEICWEVSLPVSESNRNLFRLIGKGKTITKYVNESLEKLEMARLQYAYDRRAFASKFVKAA